MLVYGGCLKIAGFTLCTTSRAESYSVHIAQCKEITQVRMSVRPSKLCEIFSEFWWLNKIGK